MFFNKNLGLEVIVLFFMGLKKLKDGLDEIGQAAVGLLNIAIIIGIIPFLGAIVGNVLSLIALIFVFFGWLRVQEGLIENPS